MGAGKDKIKDLFSSKLSSFESEVPASVWGGLDQLLSAAGTASVDSSSTASSSSSSAVGQSLALKLIITIVGLAAAIITGVYLFNREDNKIVLEEPERKEYIVKADSVEAIEEDSVAISPIIAFNKVKDHTYTPMPINDESLDQEIDAESIREEESENVVEEGEDLITSIASLKEAIDIAPVLKSEKKRSLSIKVISDIGLSTYLEQSVGSNMLLSKDIRGQELLEFLDKDGRELILEHNRPISFGIAIEKELSSRLSLEAGLIYTFLSSKLDAEGRYPIRETQSFNYLGVPVSLNYTFYKIKEARFYLSIGGMIQKDIKGEYISHLDFPKPIGGDIIEESIFYKEPYYVKKYLKQTNPQFSVRSKFGVVYPLSKKLYIYGAIGGVYYFDAKNKYRTIYSDKKTQLDLNLGVKYEF